MLFRVLLLCLSLASPALAEELRGQVVAIADGDTLTLLTPERRQVRVRLAEIDTPERRQPYGTRARQALSELAFRREVRVVAHSVDRNGRTIGRVYVGTVDVNAELVRRGAAWVYRQFSDDAALALIEAQARTERRGLWGLPEALRLPPWEWRRERRRGRAPPVAQDEVAVTP